MTDLATYLAGKIAVMSTLSACLVLVAMTGALGVTWVWVVSEVRRVTR